MRLTEIENRAKDLGIKDTWKYDRKQLIKMIQRIEGNSDCFASIARRFCEQVTCCWRPDCVR